MFKDWNGYKIDVFSTVYQNTPINIITKILLNTRYEFLENKGFFDILFEELDNSNVSMEEINPPEYFTDTHQDPSSQLESMSTGPLISSHDFKFTHIFPKPKFMMPKQC